MVSACVIYFLCLLLLQPQQRLIAVALNYGWWLQSTTSNSRDSIDFHDSIVARTLRDAAQGTAVPTLATDIGHCSLWLHSTAEMLAVPVTG